MLLATTQRTTSLTAACFTLISVSAVEPRLHFDELIPVYMSEAAEFVSTALVRLSLVRGPAAPPRRRRG